MLASIAHCPAPLQVPASKRQGQAVSAPGKTHCGALPLQKPAHVRCCPHRRRAGRAASDVTGSASRCPGGRRRRRPGTDRCTTDRSRCRRRIGCSGTGRPRCRWRHWGVWWCRPSPGSRGWRPGSRCCRGTRSGRRRPRRRTPGRRRRRGWPTRARASAVAEGGGGQRAAGAGLRAAAGGAVRERAGNPRGRHARPGAHAPLPPQAARVPCGGPEVRGEPAAHRRRGVAGFA